MTFDKSEYIRVVCAIIEKENFFLVAQRKPESSNGGLWEFPGGKINTGESEKDALVREINEELSICIVPEKKLSPVNHTYPQIKITLIPFICKIISGTIHPHEHQAVKFITKEEAISLAWAPADIPILSEYLDSRNK